MFSYNSIGRSQRNGISNPLHTIIIKYLDQLMWYIEETKATAWVYDSCQCNFTAQCPPMNQTCVKSFFFYTFFFYNDIWIRAYTVWRSWQWYYCVTMLMRTLGVRCFLFFFGVILVFCSTPIINDKTYCHTVMTFRGEI